MPTDAESKVQPVTRMTPLWVISLFLTLTETVLGVAATQTMGGVQVALVVFVMCFPILVALAFFALLWHKPWAFYPPSEYDKNVSVEQFVKALGGLPNEVVRETLDVKGPVEVVGNPDRLKLLFKAVGKTWVRSSKAMDVGAGCIVQVSTKTLTPQGSWNVAEALTYVPGSVIVQEQDGDGRYLAKREDCTTDTVK